MNSNLPVKLITQDQENLTTLSSLVQDAVVIPTESDYDPQTARFVLMLTRYRWEEKRRWWKPKGERVRAALQINTVQAARTRGFDPKDRDSTLALLAVTAPEQDSIELVFSGGAAIRLQVEAIDVMLTDIGDPFEAIRRPLHP